MNVTSTDAILAQIRALNAEADTLSQAVPTQNGANFAATLERSIDAVNGLQGEAKAQSIAFQQGSPDTSLVDVMLASQKASLSFHAATEVRNKLVTAYQEIMNMPV